MSIYNLQKMYDVSSMETYDRSLMGGHTILTDAGVDTSYPSRDAFNQEHRQTMGRLRERLNIEESKLRDISIRHRLRETPDMTREIIEYIRRSRNLERNSEPILDGGCIDLLVEMNTRPSSPPSPPSPSRKYILVERRGVWLVEGEDTIKRSFLLIKPQRKH